MLWIVGALVLVWVPLRRSRLGLAIYAVGSNRKAAFLSGVRIARTRVLAYSIGGLFAGFAGLVITASTGGGEPRATIGTNATLNSVAAVVLGGVALTGGVGGLVGPVLAALCLTLIPAIMLGLGWDPSNAETARGVIIILVVLVAGLLQTRRRTDVSDDTPAPRRAHVPTAAESTAVVATIAQRGRPAGLAGAPRRAADARAGRRVRRPLRRHGVAGRQPADASPACGRSSCSPARWRCSPPARRCAC